jgi:hypothetical protein
MITLLTILYILFFIVLYRFYLKEFEYDELTTIEQMFLIMMCILTMTILITLSLIFLP